MNEIDFYPEICEKFSKILINYLPSGSQIEYSYNKILPKMISEIDDKFYKKNTQSEMYIPALKLDILFGIKLPSNDLKYILFEVKYLTQLSLSDYSQLLGYLQVAKLINLGILLLVAKKPNFSKLSNDFTDIIRMKNLPMQWKLIINKLKNEVIYNFETGICSYIPNNGFEWIETRDIDGIYNFEKLVDVL